LIFPHTWVTTEANYSPFLPHANF